MRTRTRKAAKFPFIPGTMIGENLLGSVSVKHLRWYCCCLELTDIEHGLVKSMVHIKTTHHIEFLEIK